EVSCTVNAPKVSFHHHRISPSRADMALPKLPEVDTCGNVSSRPAQARGQSDRAGFRAARPAPAPLISYRGFCRSCEAEPTVITRLRAKLVYTTTSLTSMLFRVALEYGQTWCACSTSFSASALSTPGR